MFQFCEENKKKKLMAKRLFIQKKTPYDLPRTIISINHMHLKLTSRINSLPTLMDHLNQPALAGS